jgi:hypothetical protein
MKKLHRVREFRAELSVSERHLRQMLADGAPHLKYRGTVWIDADRFYAWLNKFERKAKPRAAKKTLQTQESIPK